MSCNTFGRKQPGNMIVTCWLPSGHEGPHLDSSGEAMEVTDPCCRQCGSPLTEKGNCARTVALLAGCSTERSDVASPAVAAPVERSEDPTRELDALIQELAVAPLDHVNDVAVSIRVSQGTLRRIREAARVITTRSGLSASSAEDVSARREYAEAIVENLIDECERFYKGRGYAVSLDAARDRVTNAVVAAPVPPSPAPAASQCGHVHPDIGMPCTLPLGHGRHSTKDGAVDWPPAPAPASKLTVTSGESVLVGDLRSVAPAPGGEDTARLEWIVGHLWYGSIEIEPEPGRASRLLLLADDDTGKVAHDWRERIDAARNAGKQVSGRGDNGGGA